MWYCQRAIEALKIKQPQRLFCCITPLLAQECNSYDWLWPYVAPVIRLHRCTGRDSDEFNATKQTMSSVFLFLFFFVMRHFNCELSQFNHDRSLLIFCSHFNRCNIVYGEGQSRVCTWLFRWWFTYILSSWVIEWLSRFPFMRKVAICVRAETSCHPFFLLFYPFLNPSPFYCFY